MPSEAQTLLARDVYDVWRRRVKAAEHSVRVFSPYLDRLTESLVSNATIDVEHISIVTDLSPLSGTREYLRQLTALKRLVQRGVEVRSLARLHAKVLLVDGSLATVGSQNFTSYARRSHETTAVPPADLAGSTFVGVLDRWHAEAEPVSLALIERLLSELREKIDAANEAIKDLVVAYEDVAEAQRAQERLEAVRRFERDLARGRAASSAGTRRVTQYARGQQSAYARLRRQDGGHQSLVRWKDYMDLTRWRMSTDGADEVVDLERLAFYPVILAPDGVMAFVRVASSRITYVWNGVKWAEPRKVGGRHLHMRANFPNEADDGANVVLTFDWSAGSREGYQVRLRFDGADALPVSPSRFIGDPWGQDLLQQTVDASYDDHDDWEAVLRQVFAPALNPRDFLSDKNAESFFPRGWLKIDHTFFLDESVLLVEPHV